MSLDVFFVQDIKKIISAIYGTHRLAMERKQMSATDIAYQEGFADALRAMSVALGISDTDLLNKK